MSFAEYTEFPGRIHRPYLFLLAFAVLGFMFLPVYRGGGLTGDWFAIGWPLPVIELKIGFVSPQSPSGMHPNFSWFGLINVVLWLTVFFGVRRIAATYNVPVLILYPAIIVAFALSVVANLFYGFWFWATFLAQ